MTLGSGQLIGGFEDALLNLKGPQEQEIQAVITEISEESVILDANHPLAGEDLTFDIELSDIV